MEKRDSQNGHQAIRILLVEDEETIQQTITIALSDEGFYVTCLPDGQTAWETLYLAELERQSGRKPFPFHLIILDLLLPHINGWEICQFIRARQNSVPILMLSARGSEDDKIVGLDIGADDYLAKPFSLRELVARCRCLLRPHVYQLTRPVVLQFGDISLYPEEHRVQVRGQDVNLALLEFRLLQLLLECPQQVRSQEELIRAIWGTEAGVHPKTLAAYINRLRDKIEPNPRYPEYIKTVRGRGYCLGTPKDTKNYAVYASSQKARSSTKPLFQE